MIKVFIGDVSGLKDRDLFQKSYSKMQEYRQRKIDKYRFEKDKRLSLGAGLLLKDAVTDLDIDYYSLEPEVNENGKPAFAKRDDICYSISHSGERVMCAISDHEIGCDVEEYAKPDYKIAERFFHAKENEYLCSIQDEYEKEKAFYKLWTCKESYLKCIGTGLKKELASFCISFGKETNVVGTDYIVSEPVVENGYAYAICSKADDNIIVEWKKWGHEI